MRSASAARTHQETGIYLNNTLILLSVHQAMQEFGLPQPKALYSKRDVGSLLLAEARDYCTTLTFRYTSKCTNVAQQSRPGT